MLIMLYHIVKDILCDMVYLEFSGTPHPSKTCLIAEHKVLITKGPTFR
jgi:hypothetical protein